MKGKLGRLPNPEEISRETGIRIDHVEQALVLSDTVSLEEPVGEDGAQRGDFIEDGDADDPEAIAEATSVAIAMRNSIKKTARPGAQNHGTALWLGGWDPQRIG